MTQVVMDGPEPPVVSLESIATADLGPLEDAAACLDALPEQLKSKDWLVAHNALTTLRQLTKFETSAIASSLSQYIDLVTKSVKSPRSALSKAALVAAGDLFAYCGEDMLPHANPLILQLLLKASQDRKFMCEEAERALTTLATTLQPIPTLHLLEPFCRHNNPRVRAKAAVSFGQCAARLTPDEASEYGLDALLQAAGKQVSDQLPEAREAARKLVVYLHDIFPLLHQKRISEGSDASRSSDDGCSVAAGARSSDASSEAEEEAAWVRTCRSCLSVTDATTILALTGAR